MEYTWITIGAISFISFLILIFRLLNAGPSIKTALSEGNGLASSSRLLLILSGVSAIIFSFAFVIFYMYAWVTLPEVCDTGRTCKQLPDFKNLINGLIALGIGVIPYSTNKLSSAIASRRTNSLTKSSIQILMKTITYKVTMYGGAGQLSVAVPGKPTISFDKTGTADQELEEGIQYITVSAIPPSGDAGKIKFEIWQGSEVKKSFDFEEAKNKQFKITVD